MLYLLKIDDEVDTHIAKGSSTFRRQRESVWEMQDIRLATKLKVDQAYVIARL